MSVETPPKQLAPSSGSSANRSHRLSHGAAPAQFFEEGMQLSDSDSDDEDSSRPLLNKGKGKATQTPLSTSRSHQKSLKKGSKRSPLLRTIKIVGCSLMLVISFALLLAFAMIHFITGRVLTRIPEDDAALQNLATKGFRLDKIDDVRFNGIDDDIINMSFEFTALFDVEKAMQPLYKAKLSALDRLEQHALAWSIARARYVDVVLEGDQQPAIAVQALHGDTTLPLADIISISPIRMPLSYRNPAASSQRIHLDVKLRVTAQQEIAEFVKTSWERKRLPLKISVPHISIRPSKELPFASWTNIARHDIAQEKVIDIPDLPFLRDPSKLVKLTSYKIAPISSSDLPSKQLFLATKQDDPIGIEGNALMVNPLIKYRHQFPASAQRMFDALRNDTIDMPYAIPFDAYIYPDPTKIGQADNQPVLFANVKLNPLHFAPLQNEVPMVIDGLVQPVQPPSVQLDAAMSAFLSRYLACQETPMLVKPKASPALPKFINAAMSALDEGVVLAIPGSPDPDAQLLQNIRIEDMKFDGTGNDGDILCSGKMRGELVLPDGLENLNRVIKIRSVLPDVLIFDGPPTLVNKTQVLLDYADFPPSPLPPKAFVRMKAAKSYPAQTHLIKHFDPVSNRTVLIAEVSADLKSVPLAILPDRSDIFRSYIAKIIFSNGSGPDGKVSTGVLGFTTAQAALVGSGFGNLTLRDISFRGSFFVGRPKMFETLNSILQAVV